MPPLPNANIAQCGKTFDTELGPKLHIRWCFACCEALGRKPDPRAGNTPELRPTTIGALKRERRP